VSCLRGLTLFLLYKENQMNALTRWERYAPVSLGIEDMFRRLDTLVDSTATNYPPYNIVKVSDTEQNLEIALAGIAKEDIEVSVEQQVLSVRTKEPNVDTREFIHKGVATRTFAKNWQLGDTAVVDEPRYENGMLIIPIRLVIPEAQQRKVLPIS
jgi:molecular chaperone IbpA